MYLKSTVNSIMYISQQHILDKYGRLEGREPKIILDLLNDMDDQLRNQDKEYVEYEEYRKLANESIHQKLELDELKKAIKTISKVFKED